MNIEQIRKDTPNCSDKIFLNSAGSSLMPKMVVKKINEYLFEEEKLGGYRVAESKEMEINDFYIQAAKLINCDPKNIAFAHDATDAYTKALSSIQFEPHDIIITTDDDYVSNHINFISLQRRYKIKVVRINNLNNGDIDINDFEALIKKYQPKLVAITHIPTNSGLIQNAEKVGEICEKNQILYLLDACQSVGQILVDVKKIRCDFLSVTGRKFLRGPRGTGFLFVSDKLLNDGYAPLFIDLRGATWTGIDKFEIMESAKRFESWEVPYALVTGLKEAIKYTNKIGIGHIQAYNQKIMKRLRVNLSSIPNVNLFDKGSNTSNLLTFIKEGKSLEEISYNLDQNHVYYSVSLKKYAFIDFSKKGIDWAVRLSPHYFNTIEEIDKVSEIIKEI